MRKHIEILHEVSIQLLGVVEEQQIYQIMSEAVEKILPDSFFVVTKLQPDDINFRVVKSSVFEKNFWLLKKLLGRSPYTLDFPIDILTHSLIEVYEKREIHHFKGGIYELTNGIISKPVCKAIEKSLGITEVYAMSFCVKKKFFGGINIYIRRTSAKIGGMNDEAKMVIEIITNQASTIIQKLREHAIVKKNEIQLAKLNDTKDKFFSIISHDLISPFNAILGFTESLTENYNDYTNEERFKIIELLRVASQNTFELIENLLEWSKIQLGHIVIKNKTSSLRYLIDDSIKPVINNAVQKRIFVENNIEHNVMICTDTYSIKAIIRNLFTNAVKFTNHEGRIIINAKQTDNNTEFSISDTGIGMSNEKISKLFRIDEHISTSGTDNEKGTGLGLILCKELIDEINGKIWVESELGVGTMFNISIPV